MSVSTAHAVKPPAHAVAPPVQRKAEPSVEMDEAPQRLLSSLSAVPTVQRACAGCGGDEDDTSMPVQPRLEVGPVNDPQEREADAIADQVMAKRGAETVQRVGADEEEDDEVMARRMPVRRMEEDEPEVMARRAKVWRMAEDDEAEVMARRATVQRKCSSCGGDEMPVMPRLEVGPVDDPYEREADDIAGRVMAMRLPPAMAEDDGIGGALDQSASVARRPILQRKCAACEAEDQMPVQPRRAAATVQRATDPLLNPEALRDLTDMPRMKAETDAGTEHISASAEQLSSGGQALAPDTRAFFEDRMGRDLSDVRVHKGQASDDLNASISARAFTFRNHIWLGRSESEGPSFTMAHEMAHVLQQTQPGPIRAKRRTATASGALVRRAPKLKFSGNAYWTSASLEKAKKNSGSQIHEDILGQFQKTHTHLLIEAPVPKARQSKKGRSRSGEADMYIGKDSAGAERTIGVNFRKKGDPVKLSSTTKQPFHSPAYSHKTSARPKMRGKSKIIGAGEAPVSISMGELKPDKVKKGKTQLKSYENAITRTRNHTNSFLAEQNKLNGTSEPEWPEITFDRIGVKPPSLSGANGTSFGKHKLHVYQFAGFKNDENWAVGNLIHEPPVDVFGELKVKKHTDGIYYYWWEPDVKATSTALPPQLASQASLTDKLFTALRTNRKVVLPKRISAKRGAQRPSAPSPEARRAPPPARVMRRKSGNAKKFPNHFDAQFETNKWLPNRKKVATAYGNVARAQTGDKGPAALTDWYLVEINKDLDAGDRQNMGQTLSPGGKAYERTRQLRKMHILSQPFAPTMAKLRRMFGGVFAKASALYEKIKSKFEGRSRPKKSISGGGILGALIKVSFKVLLLIGRQIVASTMIQLTEQLKSCMTKMFEKYFSIDDEVEAIEARVDSVKSDVEAKVKSFIDGDVETMAETLFGPYGEQVDKIRSYIETITDIAGPILTAYKVVRWGIQALACASPPLVGCLWGLATSAIEWAAAKVMDTCWFMKKVTPKILKIKKIRSFMKSTSVKLSNGIIDAGAGLFPDPVGSFLKTSCKAKAPSVSMPKSKSICEEGGGSGGMGNDPKPSKEALAFWARWEKLSHEKRMALKKMIGVKNARGGAKVDWDKMNKMVDWANKHSLSEMQELAKKAAKGNSSAIPGAVAAVKSAAEGSKKGGAKSGGSTSGGTKSKDSGGSDDDGGGTTTARRTKEPQKSAGKASDLRPYMFIPDTKAAPTQDKPVTGEYYIAWAQPKGDPKIIRLPNMKMIYRGSMKGRKVGDMEFDRWKLEATKTESFEVEGRDGGFIIVKGRVYHLYVPKEDSDDSKKK